MPLNTGNYYRNPIPLVLSYPVHSFIALFVQKKKHMRPPKKSKVLNDDPQTDEYVDWCNC